MGGEWDGFQLMRHLGIYQMIVWILWWILLCYAWIIAMYIHYKFQDKAFYMPATWVTIGFVIFVALVKGRFCE